MPTTTLCSRLICAIKRRKCELLIASEWRLAKTARLADADLRFFWFFCLPRRRTQNTSLSYQSEKYVKKNSPFSSTADSYEVRALRATAQPTQLIRRKKTKTICVCVFSSVRDIATNDAHDASRAHSYRVSTMIRWKTLSIKTKPLARRRE